MKHLFSLLIAAAGGALLPGCAVYAPMQCAAPAIAGQRQAELSGSTYLTGRVEVAGTYSPFRHVLLRAAYSRRADDTLNRQSRYFLGSQYDVAFGAYGTAGPGWVVGGLAGGGRGQNRAGVSANDSLGGIVNRRYDVRFDKVFAEAYATYQVSDKTSLGAACRVTQVSFTRLTERGAPLPLARMARAEPMVYLRVRPRLGAADVRPLQVQWAVGWSSTFGFDERGAAGPIADVKQGRGYMTLTASVFPHCFFQKRPPAAPAP